MATSRWKKIEGRIGEILDWVVILIPGILVGSAVFRWLGWTLVDSFYAGIVAIPMVGLLVMNFRFKRGTKVIEECLDPDFGELTKFRDSWLSILDLTEVEEPLFLRGEGTHEPTIMQRSSLIEIVDTWRQWTEGLRAALVAMKNGGVPEKPWELYILDIKLDSHEAEWEVSILVSKGDEDYDFLAKFCQGRLVELKRDEI
jgi:hypothetical protein